MIQPKGLPYYGGKSPGRGLGRWIANVVGFDPAKGYVEPFGGMLGVLCARPKAKVEVVNDIDGNLVNWWLCVRDHTDELARRVSFTPRSRTLFEQAIDELYSGIGDPIDRALYFHIVVTQSLQHTGWRKCDWGVAYIGGGCTTARWVRKEFVVLADRLALTQIENRCALDILGRTQRDSNLLVYCDPPYKSADTRPYGDTSVDWHEMTSLLLAQPCEVAVSGYGDEWDHLGWYRSVWKDKFTKHINRGKDRRVRNEILWTNFAPQQGDLFHRG